MMMTYRKAISIVKTSLFVFSSLFFLASCQEDEFEQVSENAESVSASASIESNVESLTITGTNAIFSDNVECSTCTYVVPKNAVIVDGEELGLKPGSVICLDAAIQYGNLEFVNLNGTEDDSITIGNCK